MLAPPPLENPDEKALEPEGRQKYLQSLKNRLNKLEGRDGPITSKDILKSLSEARDDHLSGGSSTGESTSCVNEFAEIDDIRGEVTCCCCLRRRSYIRGRRNMDSLEYKCLIECDELDLNNTAEGPDSSNQSINHDNQFNDNFV